MPRDVLDSFLELLLVDAAEDKRHRTGNRDAIVPRDFGHAKHPVVADATGCGTRVNRYRAGVVRTGGFIGPMYCRAATTWSMKRVSSSGAVHEPPW